MADDLSTLGETLGPPFTAQEKEFLIRVAHRGLNSVDDTDTLKHFADVWWNLCNWEARRVAVIDGKAQGLLSLASVVGTVVAVATAMGGEQHSGAIWRAISVLMFVVAAAVAILGLRLKDHGGFNDKGVFDALTYDGEVADWFPEFNDKTAFNLYLREIAMQRWSVYRRFKNTIAQKVQRVLWAQHFALFGACFLSVSIFVQIFDGATRGRSAGAQAAAATASTSQPIASASPKQ